MKDKEFTLEGEDEEICQVYRNGDCMGTDEVVDTLNELHEINGRCNHEITLNHQKILKLMNENEDLKRQKERYKRLSEIRNEEINNRILIIKEFIDNCSNEEVKKTLKDLFYSEVNEYNLSKKYRKLHEENEDLKEDNAILRHALTRLVEAFDDKISDKSPIRDLIK